LAAHPATVIDGGGDPSGQRWLSKLALRATAHPGQSWDLYGSTHLHADGETSTCPGGYWQPVCRDTNIARTKTVSDPGCAGVSQKFYKAITR
jgi:hypothetical protein